MAKADGLFIDITANSRQAVGQIKNTEKSLKEMAVQIGITGIALATLVKSFKSLAQATDFSVRSAANFEKIETRLTSLYGSAVKAKMVFAEFKKIAATTPFQIQDIANAGLQLKAFGMDAEKTTKAVADLAAFMGTDVVYAANSVGRAFAGGAGAADVLRERGILALVKSFKGIEDTAKITLPEFRKALIETLQDPMAGIAGSTTRLADTYIGATSNMKDAVTALSAEIGESLLPVLTDTIKIMTDFVRTLIESDTQTAIRHMEEYGAAIEDTFGLKLKDGNKQLKTLSESFKEITGTGIQTRKMFDKHGEEISMVTDLTKMLGKETRTLIDLEELLEKSNDGVSGSYTDLLKVLEKNGTLTKDIVIQYRDYYNEMINHGVPAQEAYQNMLNSLIKHEKESSKEIEKAIKIQQEYNAIKQQSIDIMHELLNASKEYVKFMNGLDKELDESINTFGDLSEGLDEVSVGFEHVGEVGKSINIKSIIGEFESLAMSLGGEAGIAASSKKAYEELNTLKESLNQIGEEKGIGSEEYKMALQSIEQYTQETIDKVGQMWAEAHPYLMSLTNTLVDQYSNAMFTMLDSDKTLLEKRRAIWKSMKSGFASMLTDMAKKYVAHLIAEAALQKGLQAAATAATVSNAAIVAAAWKPGAIFSTIAMGGLNIPGAIASFGTGYAAMSGMGGAIDMVSGNAADGAYIDQMGVIHGAGSGRSDSILAKIHGGNGGIIRVSNGERVMLPSAVGDYSGILAAMNSGDSHALARYGLNYSTRTRPGKHNKQAEPLSQFADGGLLSLGFTGVGAQQLANGDQMIDIPAGSFIMNAGASSKYKKMLNKINYRNASFAQGGLIDSGVGFSSSNGNGGLGNVDGAIFEKILMVLKNIHMSSQRQQPTKSTNITNNVGLVPENDIFELAKRINGANTILSKRGNDLQGRY